MNACIFICLDAFDHLLFTDQHISPCVHNNKQDNNSCKQIMYAYRHQEQWWHNRRYYNTILQIHSNKTKGIHFKLFYSPCGLATTWSKQWLLNYIFCFNYDKSLIRFTLALITFFNVAFIANGSLMLYTTQLIYTPPLSFYKRSFKTVYPYHWQNNLTTPY